jgi:AraC-like DNA-binding protein
MNNPSRLLTRRSVWPGVERLHSEGARSADNGAACLHVALSLPRQRFQRRGIQVIMGGIQVNLIATCGGYPTLSQVVTMHTQADLEYAPNTYLRQFFRYLGSRDDLLHNTSESANTLAQLGGTHSIQDYCQFLRNAREIFEDPAIGLRLGRISQLGTMHGAVGTAIYNSSTLHDCLRILDLYGSLRGTVIDLNWVEDRGLVGLDVCFTQNMGDVHPAVTEVCLSILFSMIMVVNRNDIQRFIIELNYPAPSYSRDYKQAFPVSSIRFSQAATRILVPKNVADHVNDSEPDQQLRASAIERCEALLSDTYRPATTCALITQLFADNSGQLWTLSDIARHLNVSISTLQRRLKKENTRFQQLQNEWLMAEATQLLSNPKLTVENIALLLGYSDVSTFRQACRRWYGMPPNALRRTLMRFPGTVDLL